LPPVHAAALALAAVRLAVDLREAGEEAAAEEVVDWTLHPKWFSAAADLPVGAAVVDFPAGLAPADPEELRRSF
jgi:hypothetical protein